MQDETIQPNLNQDAPAPQLEPGFELLETLLEVPSFAPAPKKMIWVTFMKEGIHHYPAALTDPKLKSVEFLGYPHRHMFHFKVAIEVFHDDRDIEFIMFKRELLELYTSGLLELNHKSCEMMAMDLHKYISQQYPRRGIKINVSEDGENGCEIIWENV